MILFANCIFILNLPLFFNTILYNICVEFLLFYLYCYSQTFRVRTLPYPIRGKNMSTLLILRKRLTTQPKFTSKTD